VTVPKARPKDEGRRIQGLDAEQRREQRRRRLLDAALDLFAAEGYAGTSIEQLCQRAYVGTKGFYEIFDSREACYIALLQDITAGTEALVTARFAAGAEESALVRAFARALVDDHRTARVAFGHGMAVTPATERQRRTNRRWAAQFLVRVWHSRDAPTGGRSEAEVQRLATGLIGGLFDLIADWLLDCDPADPAAVDALLRDLESFYAVVRTGLAEPPAGPGPS
jgi:AcrR family transcriptional regulator